jgi:hypothetical protein
MIKEVETLKFEQEQQNTVVVNELQRRIAQYTVQLRESSIISKGNDREVTGDYLVLRHNSRVAKEMLIRSQNEANCARKVLQEGMDQVSIAAASQREKIEQSSEAELQSLTDTIRNKVLKREQEFEELSASRLKRMRSSKKLIRSLTSQCDEFNEKYEDLQTQRRNDLERVGSELRRLRVMVSSVEVRLLKLSVTDNDQINKMDKYVGNKENRLLEKNGRAIIENLEHRLKLLRSG